MEFNVGICNEINERIQGIKDESEKVNTIFAWLNEEFEWVQTDYVERTVEEILARRAGNCAEQAKVVEKVLTHIGIETRWILEINSHSESMERQNFSLNLIEKHGDFYSIFGWNHNDHRWLEYYNNNLKQWIPIDTAFGVLNINHWLEKRMSFTRESIPTTQQIIPFCIVALSKKRDVSEVLSNFYLIDQFDKFYNGMLSETTVWEEWKLVINKLTEVGIETYSGRSNLHKYQNEIKRFTNLYLKLKQEVLTNAVI
ncbi:transglutaminase-like domain-containing protein [Bacillus sp. GX]|uniref:transglutaminase-like domain-containing protein n=1 Tax=Bacillus TaxID=1386 RepID=UPI0021168B90|nr:MULTISPECIES: transglutaminase-like domain-containing protein [Bacillus]WPU75982.1 transglutaminase-like domain-containing protein [Bacillus sp. RA(2023)]